MWFNTLQLTIVGMGVVFFFLYFLACSINLLGAVTVKLFPEDQEPSATPEQVNDELVAAIIAAVVSKK